jgi:hypothetical protein
MKALFSSAARVLVVAASAAVIAPAQAAPDDYPKRPIALVVGFSAGGPTDTVARYLARKLEAELGQPVVVDNRAGANGVVALQAVKRASPDGYTLMLGSSGTLSIEPVYKGLHAGGDGRQLPLPASGAAAIHVQGRGGIDRRGQGAQRRDLVRFRRHRRRQSPGGRMVCEGVAGQALPHTLQG